MTTARKIFSLNAYKAKQKYILIVEICALRLFSFGAEQNIKIPHINLTYIYIHKNYTSLWHSFFFFSWMLYRNNNSNNMNIKSL